MPRSTPPRQMQLAVTEMRADRQAPWTALVGDLEGHTGGMHAGMEQINGNLGWLGGSVRRVTGSVGRMDRSIDQATGPMQMMGFGR